MTRSGVGFFQEIQQFKAVVDFTANVDALDAFDDLPDPFPKHGMIIGQNNIIGAHSMPPLQVLEW